MMHTGRLYCISKAEVVLKGWTLELECTSRAWLGIPCFVFGWRTLGRIRDILPALGVHIMKYK